MNELDSSNSRTDHDKMFGQCSRRVGIASRQDALAIDMRPVRNARTTSRGQQHHISLKFNPPGLSFGDDLVWTHHASRAKQELDPLAFEKRRGRTLETFTNRRNPATERVEVERCRHIGETHALGIVDASKRAARGDHGFRWHAIAEMRCSANEISLDHRDLCAKSSRIGRRSVTRRATTDDYEMFCHCSSRYRGL